MRSCSATCSTTSACGARERPLIPARNPRPPASARAVLEVLSRKPLRLPETTVEQIRERPVPAVRRAKGRPVVNVIVPVLDNLVPPACPWRACSRTPTSRRTR